MTTLTYTTTLDTLTCGVCSIPFAMPRNLHEKAQQTGENFWCPNGHRIHYFEDENTRLKARLDQARADARWQREARDRARADADHQAARARGYKGALTKTKKRIGRGVCPCCNRHFANVDAHMATKHPDYANDDDG
jgi:hypothetical protein